MLMATITEVERDFAAWRTRAQTQPVSVTEAGETCTVILSAEEYRRLKRRDRQALRVEELDDDVLAALAASEPPEEAAAYDHEAL